MSRICALLTACVLLTGTAQAQNRANVEEQFRVGNHIFRHLLNAQELTPLNSWNEVLQDPAHTIVIILGHPRRHFHELDPLLRAGGAALIASDQEINFVDLDHQIGHRTAHRFGRVKDRTDEVLIRPGFPDLVTQVQQGFRYRNSEDCVLVDATPNPGPPLFWDSPLRRSKLRIAVNQSNYLEPTRVELPEGARLLARFPRGCWYSNEPLGFLLRQRDPYAFAFSLERDRGRLLVMADHSVFINDMLLQGWVYKDNDNLIFANQVIEWLRRDGSERHRVLFVDDGGIETVLNPALDPFSLRGIQAALAEKLNGVASKLQSDHRFDNLANRWLVQGVGDTVGRGIFRRGTAESFFLVVVVAAGIAAGIFGLRRLLKASHKTDSGAPVLATVLPRQIPTGSPLALRQKAAFAEGELRDVAGEIVRDWFASLPNFPADYGSQRPHVKTHTGWSHGRKLRNTIESLWRLAYLSESRPLNRMGLRTLLAQLERLRTAMDVGELEIEWGI